MQIPRFSVQIQQIQVPRMQDYEYEQNRSIYETMKKAGETISNTFFEMVAQGSMPFQQGKTTGKPRRESEQFKEYEKSVGVSV